MHCRRRKIRCLVAADDPQGRCENCIRLRKDCQFFPVDQQPPVEKKSRPSSRLETASGGSATTPISSSPTNLNGESVDTFYQYPQVAMNSSGQDMAAFPPGAFAGNPLAGFVPGRLMDQRRKPRVIQSLTRKSHIDQSMGPGEFTRHPMEAGVWDEFTTISDPQMLATMNANKNQMMNLSPNVWPAGLPPNSPMSAASPMAGQAQPMNPGATYAMQPDGSVWQVPPQPSRAMSYPGQDMGSSFPQQFQPHMPPDLKRRMTTPAHTVASQGASGPSPDMQVPPGSYPAQAGMGFPQWANMNAMPGMAVMQYPMYGDVQQQPFPNPSPMGHPGGPGRSGP